MQRILKYKIITLLFILTLSSKSLANDNELWGVANLSGKINSKWSIDFTHQQNFNNRWKNNYFTYTHLRIGRKITEKLKTKAGYRHVFHRQEGVNWNPEYRPTIEFSYKFDIPLFAISDRHRFSYRIFSNKERKNFLWQRNFLDITPDISFTPLNVTPYIGNELFFNQKTLEFTGNHLYLGIKVSPLENFQINMDYIWFKANSEIGWKTIHVSQIVLLLSI